MSENSDYSPPLGEFQPADTPDDIDLWDEDDEPEHVCSCCVIHDDLEHAENLCSACGMMIVDPWATPVVKQSFTAGGGE